MSQSKTRPGDPDRVVCRNRKALHEYEIVDQLDCGIMLHGSEVKSVRNNKVTLEEGFARIERGEVWLYNVDIAEYSEANQMNHPLRRPRKLLLKKKEITKFAARADESGMSLIPLDVHFSRGFVKVRLGVGKGRKLHDKREKLKSDDARREIQQAMRQRNR
ncbi:MAG: SsrA-binding protein SmpB [Planctomycetota bacterium]|nr:MAG: SsrA-binding protein SmpB [Planctomycetota bacterium]